MIVLGLTGSIGMGKTTVARMLEKLGCAIHDSDEIVHQALNLEGGGFEEVALSFPTSWDKKKHLINRKILSDIIFKDKNKKKKLEDILHPIVRYAQKEFVQKQKRLGRKVIVLDIPLLFETGAQDYVDYTLVVSSPLHIQKQRVLSRPNMSEKKFESILEAQMPDHEKRARADFVIPTGMGLAYTYKILQKCLKEIQKKGV